MCLVVQLRKQLAHYDAKVTVRIVWYRAGQWLLAFSSIFVYIAVRLAYLITGRSAKLNNDPRASTIYSIIVLIIESVLGLMSLSGSMLFWKQEVHFSRAAALEVRRVAIACSPICQVACRS